MIQCLYVLLLYKFQTFWCLLYAFMCNACRIVNDVMKEFEKWEIKQANISGILRVFMKICYPWCNLCWISCKNLVETVVYHATTWTMNVKDNGNHNQNLCLQVVSFGLLAHGLLGLNGIRVWQKTSEKWESPLPSVKSMLDQTSTKNFYELF